MADLLVLGTLASSKGAARQLIRQGGVTLGDRRVDQSDERVQREQFGPDGLLVRAGKKRFHGSSSPTNRRGGAVRAGGPASRAVQPRSGRRVPAARKSRAVVTIPSRTCRTG